MDTQRIRPAELLSLLAGTALLISPFLEWYGGAAGWSSSPVVAAILSLVAIAAIGLFFAVLLSASPAPAIWLGVWLVPLGIIATLVAAVRIAAPPTDGARGAGAWIALVAAALTLVGAWRSIGDERPHRGADTATPPPRP
ncbi:MAG: hypothetical protein NVS1B9_14490 [Solirubrobacteraceae bacterium]